MIIQLTSISKLRVDLLPMCVHVVLGRGLKEDQQVLLTATNVYMFDLAGD